MALWPCRIHDLVVIHVLTQTVRHAQAGETVALCTVVRTRGSTPQEKGAAMLVLRDGNTLGTLGGGCVEAEVRLRAQRLMNENQSRLLSFRLDQDYGWDDGLVCGGIMEIAVQVIASSESAAFIAHVLNEHDANRPAKLCVDVFDEQMQPARFEIEVPPTPRLLIAGAGHVGQALAEIARKMDFDVTVIDDRADCATAERFPGAQCIVGDIENELSRQRIDEQTYIVIVTRGHRHDGRALGAVIASKAAYVGLIGSKRKIRTILDDLHRQGATREQLEKVHAPIGLEIGAVTPSEIAVSIAAELIATRRGHGGGPAAPMKIPADQLDRWLSRERAAPRQAK
jgi:xanthine dehydrogenase accessory factor